MLTGAGYIGAALLRRLDDGPVVVLDNFFCTPREAVEAALPDGVTLIEGNVAEPDDVARAFAALPQGPVTVFHLAAQPSASIAMRDPAVTERSNLVGARVVLETARDRRARVVFGGSFRVYGDDLGGTRVDETTPYGRVADLSHLSKIYVEQLARMLGVPFVSVRLGVTYGLSPIMKATPSFMTVPNLFCQRAVRGEPLQVLEDRPMGFIHVDDAADALLASAPLAESGWRAVNAAPQVATIGEVARTVQRLAQTRGAHVAVHGQAATEAATEIPSEAPTHPTFEVRSELALQPRHTLASGLVDVLDYFDDVRARR